MKPKLCGFAALTATLIFAPLCLAQNTVTLNGFYWKGLSLEQQLAFATGYIDGFGSGYIQGKVDISLIYDPAQAGSKRAAVAHKSSDDDPSNMTFGQLRDGIDECFKDFRNQSLQIEECADWAALGANGASDSIREKDLELWRKAALQSGKQ